VRLATRATLSRACARTCIQWMEREVEVEASMWSPALTHAILGTDRRSHRYPAWMRRLTEGGVAARTGVASRRRHSPLRSGSRREVPLPHVLGGRQPLMSSPDGAAAMASYTLLGAVTG
jgi:hypothetical protein